MAGIRESFEEIRRQEYFAAGGRRQQRPPGGRALLEGGGGGCRVAAAWESLEGARLGNGYVSGLHLRRDLTLLHKALKYFRCQIGPE